MKIVFWQNILSIHQSAFLRSLAETMEVILAVDKETEERRIKDGWDRPNFGNVRIYVSPSELEIEGIFNLSSAIHIFSGVASYPFVHKAFKIAVKKKLFIGLISEPFNWIGIKGKLRLMKYFLFKVKYGKSIRLILAIGHKGRQCFERARFPKSLIFDWGYFTELSPFEKQDIFVPHDEKPNIIYVGRVSKVKGIIELVKLCKTLEDKFGNLTIIGQGTEREALLRVIGSSPKYNYLGTVSNLLVPRAISHADLTILPSIGKDGWGAVINESLMQGIPVVTSNYCGASVLLDGEVRGGVFSIEENNLSQVLTKWLTRGKASVEGKRKIRRWAEENITGKVAAKYFLDIIKSLNEKERTEQPVAPWIKNK